MEHKLKKFLQFNGKNVYFIAANGIWYIAIKPICEALKVEYTRQFKNIKADENFGPALATQPMQVGNDQLRNYACLPEFFAYGWILSIQSESKDLKAYKWKCYELIYNYFHGTITERTGILKTKTLAETKRDKAFAEMMATEAGQKFKEANKEVRKAGKSLKQTDMEFINSHRDLWSQE